MIGAKDLAVILGAVLAATMAAPSTAQQRSQFFEITHIDTHWINHGYCAFVFRADASGGGPSAEVRDVEIVLEAPNGESATLAFGAESPMGTGAGRYSQSAVDLPCGADSLRIRSATATLDGERRALKVSIGRFEPVKILE